MVADQSGAHRGARLRATSPWVANLLLVGVLFIGIPDGAKIVNLGAAIIMAAGLVPFGLTMMVQ